MEGESASGEAPHANVEAALDKLPDNVTISKWANESTRNKNDNLSNKMHCVRIKETKEVYRHNFMKDSHSFTGHVSRMYAQFAAVKYATSHIDGKSCTAQMDFAENYKKNQYQNDTGLYPLHFKVQILASR